MTDVVTPTYTGQNGQSSHTQPHNSTAPFLHTDTPSDPSSSSNSTIITGDLTHPRSVSSNSEESPSVEVKYFPSDTPAAPPSTLSNEVPYFSRPSDLQQPSPSPRPQKTRARSSSSSMLARLTSRSSSYLDYNEPSSPSSNVSGSSPIKPKLDRAALAKPKGKYKSGVNWDSSPMNLAAGEEPFMEQISPPVERTQEDLESSMKIAEIEEMAATGSTKAALAWSRANSFGDPIFANHRRAMADASAKAVMGSASPASSPSPYRSKAASFRVPTDSGRSSNLRFNGSESMNGISEDTGASRQGEDASREGTPSTNSEDLIIGVGQQVLDSARKAAADSTDAAESSKQNSASSTPPSLSAQNEATRTSKQAKRRTFMGFGGGVKKEKKGKQSKGQKTVQEEAEDEANEGAVSRVEDEEQRRREDTPRQTTEPVNGSRKRRFNDTRQLNMLANELAAEAMMGAQDGYTSLLPEARRASMMSMLAATNIELGGASPANTSQISLHHSGPGSFSNLAMPHPAFVNEHGRSISPATTSSRSGSPRMSHNDLPRFDPPRAPFARSQPSLSTPSSPLGSQKAKMTGLPTDMLAGLGDGPYPTLPIRGLDMSEGSAITPPTFDSGSEHRNSLPDVFTRSRGTSTSSSQQLPKRSVLQMSMHNPEAEMQGLTKLPKSSRSTPFGSRAPSKQVTPNPSYSNLRDRANASVSPTLLSRELAKNNAHVEKSPSPLLPQVEAKREESNAEIDAKGQKARPAPIEPRRSFFGKKVKSKPEEASNSDHLVPPTPAINKAQSLQSVGNANLELRQGSACRSANSLVMVPSPTNSNTTTSASSHDPNAFAYSSDGGSQQQGFSAVTTPEALPLKLEAMTLQGGSVNSDGYPNTSSIVNESSPLRLGGSPVQQVNRASPIPATPRSMSAASKASNNSSLGRINKFKSLFGNSKSPTPAQRAPSAVPASSAPPPREFRSNRNVHNNNNNTHEKRSGGEESPPVMSNNNINNGSLTPTGAGPRPPLETAFKNFHSKLQNKVIV